MSKSKNGGDGKTKTKDPLGSSQERTSCNNLTTTSTTLEIITLILKVWKLVLMKDCNYVDNRARNSLCYCSYIPINEYQGSLADDLIRNSQVE